MSISEKRSKAFEDLGVSGMARWLRVAAENYFLAKQSDPHVFSPFELFVLSSDSPAMGIEAGYQTLSPEGQASFRDAIAIVFAELDVRSNNAPIWRIIFELAWLLPAPGALKIIEQRFTDAAIDLLCESEDFQFHELISFVSNLAVVGPEAERLMRRMVESRRFDFHYARNMLLRLCEISPDNWTNHFALMRDKLYRMFMEGLATPEKIAQAQDELSNDILDVIGFDRFANGIVRLYLINDGWWQRPSDGWFWASLAERTRRILLRFNVAICWIAAKERPNDWRTLLNVSVVYLVEAEEAISDQRLLEDNETVDEKELDASADVVLGRSPPRSQSQDHE